MISYILGETYIVFVQTQERFLDIPYHRCRVGLNHLAFHGDGREFVNELTEELREKGVKILYEYRHPYAGGPNYYAVFFEDPDRIKVEITAHLLSTSADKEIITIAYEDKIIKGSSGFLYKPSRLITDILNEDVEGLIITGGWYGETRP